MTKVELQFYGQFNGQKKINEGSERMIAIEPNQYIQNKRSMRKMKINQGFSVSLYIILLIKDSLQQQSDFNGQILGNRTVNSVCPEEEACLEPSHLDLQRLLNISDGIRLKCVFIIDTKTAWIQ